MEARDNIYRHLEKDPILNLLIRRFGNLQIEPRKERSGFEFLVRTIIGQQLSVAAARTIFERLTIKIQDITPSQIRLNLALLDAREIGISKAKYETIIRLAMMIESDGETNLEKRIISIKGIGPWTVKMYQLFFQGKSDIFPFEDGAFSDEVKRLYQLKKYKEDKVNWEKLSDSWKPYQSYAALYMWRSKDSK